MPRGLSIYIDQILAGHLLELVQIGDRQSGFDDFRLGFFLARRGKTRNPGVDPGRVLPSI